MYARVGPVEDVKPKDFPEGWGTPRGTDPGQEGAGPAHELFRLDTVEVKLIREEDGRITVSSPQLDLAAFGSSELEAWENFLSALERLREFYFENKATLSQELRRKLQIFECLYVIRME